MKTILEILAAGEYDYTHRIKDRQITKTRGLWQHGEVVIIPGKETIHGNKLTIHSESLQIGETGKLITEEFIFMAHGRGVTVSADRMIEELRKHI